MYWRVNKYGPRSIISRYGSTLALAASVGLNLLLYTMLQGQANRPSPVVQRDCEDLARRVATELVDTSYISFRRNTEHLLSGQSLRANVVAAMQQQGLLPRTAAELAAIERQLTEKRAVTTVRIDELRCGDPVRPSGFLPVEVSGVAASQSATGAMEHPFAMELTIGVTANGDGTFTPVVVDLQAMGVRPAGRL